jgi:hypothetical protein
MGKDVRIAEESNNEDALKKTLSITKLYGGGNILKIDMV